MARRLFAIAILIAGLTASAFVAARRVGVESRNRAVEIVIDYSEVSQIVAGSGMGPVDVLRRLKSAGVTSVAVSEQTMRDLIESHLVLPYGDQQFAVSEMVAPRVTKRLRLTLADGPNRIQSTPIPGARYSRLTIREDLPMEYIEQLPAGFPERALKQVKAAGLEVLGRLVNYPGATPRAIDALLADARSQGIRKVVFLGDQVLGYRGATRATARAMRRWNVIFGRVEFAKQKGEQDIARRVPDMVVMTHSITQNEMPALDGVSVAERFQKAVKERGVRMVYVRLLDTASADLIRTSTEFIWSIANRIRAAGYTPGIAHPFEEVAAPLYLRVLAGAGVGAGALLLLFTIVELSTLSAVIWSVAALAVCTALPAVGDTGRKAVALLSALIFPSLGVLNAARSAPKSPTTAAGTHWRVLARVLQVVAAAVAGGVLIVGLLSSRVFMLRIDQFAGIKVAHVVPVFLLAGLFAGGIAWHSDTWHEQKKRLAESLRKLASDPVLMWQAAGLTVVVVIIALMVARSGNDAGLEVSGLELKFRALLDRVMLVRPRTKEFLIGYPALILGIRCALAGRRRLAASLLVIGSIGLVSVVNTFCHIHTPLAVSALRTLNGLIMGGVIGALACALLRKTLESEGN